MITDPQRQALISATAAVVVAAANVARLSVTPITPEEYDALAAEVIGAWTGTGQVSEKAAVTLADALGDIFRTALAVNTARHITRLANARHNRLVESPHDI